MRFADTFEKHRSEPGKSLDAYLNELRLALGESIASRHKVYLDTKYWILLRDHRLGRKVESTIAELSSLLEASTISGKLICPISADIYLEIIRQSDPAMLKCSTELIDALSEGVSILSPQERTRMELLYFLRKNLSGEGRCHSQGIFVWTKVAYVLGFRAPYDTAFSPEEELVVQKSFLDKMWTISLTDMIETMGPETFREMSRMSDISHDLNVGKFAHISQNATFRDVFLCETAGVLDTLKPELMETLVYLYKDWAGNTPTEEDLSASDGAQEFANFIHHFFSHDKITTELPSIRIPATIHAAVRLETKRKYKRNDVYDFRHAEAALPYFDTFLTDSSLRHLLSRRDLGLDRLYKCVIVSEPDSALAEIKKVINRS